MKGLYAKHQGFFPKYVGGVYEFFDEEKPSAMVVSRGLSYQKLSLPRIGTNPELVVIDVVPHESRF
jgi:predicted MPP superfamily phosphohydrolase